MNKELSEGLLDFYQKILAPEFASIHKKQAEHDGKFIDILTKEGQLPIFHMKIGSCPPFRGSCTGFSGHRLWKIGSCPPF